MGLEFGYQNPRAATQIVFEQFPTLASTLKPDVATESMMQLANVFRGDMDKRQGWGWHDMAQLAVLLRPDPQDRPDHQAGQGRGRVHERLHPGRQRLRQGQGQGRRDGFKLKPEMQAVDVEAIEARL